MAFNAAKRSDTSEYGDYSEPTAVTRSFFSKTMRIEGEIISDEDLTIEGKVNGQLKISKTLTIGKEGFVYGEITAALVRIGGEVEGIVHASEKLEISAGGKFNGHIKAEKIVVSEGAQLKGTINLEENTISHAKKKSPQNESPETSKMPVTLAVNAVIDPSDTTELPAAIVATKDDVKADTSD